MKKQLNRQELSFFFGQLAMILHAGISVLEGILILKEDAPGGEGTEILTDIQESLETKGILWEALKDSGVFPEYAVHMTEVGERCGTLEEVFSSLSYYYEKEEAFIKGIAIQLSNNLMTEQRQYYSYFEYAGVVNLSGNLLRQNKGVTLKVDDAPELAPGDSFDLLSLVSIFDIYENEEIVTPDVNMITAKISTTNTAKAQVIKENESWILKLGSDIEENFSIEVEISLAGGIQTGKVVFGVELDNPEDVLNIQWGMLDMDGMTGLYGFDLDTTMDELFEGFGAGSAYTYSAEDKNGQGLSGEDIVRTEAVVTLYKNGQPVAEYTLCLFGDVTGDGAINISDILAIKRHILAQRTIEGMGCAAADVNGDGSINISDLLAVKRDILGQRKIDQQRDS